MSNVDPTTRLTPVEKRFIAWLDATSTRETVLTQLKDNLQTAIEIELATIPIYLYAYYALLRNAVSGESLTPVQQFANKAGAVIMSVAVEEMLHMSLSSNVLFALGIAPRLYGKAPTKYPAQLPHHRLKGPPGPHGGTAALIPLAKPGFEQLWHFLQIEYPEQWDAFPEDHRWQTIGQFYSYIRCLISTQFITDADFQANAADHAIQPYNYSPNNIDTVYPRGRFDPWKPAPPVPTPKWAAADTFPSAAAAAEYTNAADSHAGPVQLMTVRSRTDALEAIDTICDQGEGDPVPFFGPSPDDDPSKRERSHYYKFLTLQAQFAEYATTHETLPKVPAPPAPVLPAYTEAELASVVYDFPDNPTIAGYPVALQPIAAFCSGLFQYMLIMTETVFRVPPAGQKLFFNEGLHRSMIWVMDKYIQSIRQIQVNDGPYAGKFMGPTFENVDLGPPKTSFAMLKKMGDEAVAAANAILAQLKTGSSLSGALQNVIYYIQLATSDTSTTKLPDVAAYW